jgi:hypothetical protein
MGLMLDRRRGVAQVDHSGSTAGYLAHLVRYPDQGVAVAVLCNVSTAGATQRAYEVADTYLAARTTLTPAAAATHTLTAADRERLEGTYASRLDGRAVTLVADGDGLRVAPRGATLLAQSATTFVTPNGQTWTFDGRGRLKTSDRYDTVDFDRVPAATLTPADLAALAGRYVSDEIETVFDVVVEGAAVAIKRRPDARIALTPVYKDAFTAPDLGLVRFRRDAGGRVTALSVVQDRIWDLRFAKQTADARPTTSAARERARR